MDKELELEAERLRVDLWQKGMINIYNSVSLRQAENFAYELRFLSEDKVKFLYRQIYQIYGC